MSNMSLTCQCDSDVGPKVFLFDVFCDVLCINRFSEDAKIPIWIQTFPRAALAVGFKASNPALGGSIFVLRSQNHNGYIDCINIWCIYVYVLIIMLDFYVTDFISRSFQYFQNEAEGVWWISIVCPNRHFRNHFDHLTACTSQCRLRDG